MPFGVTALVSPMRFEPAPTAFLGAVLALVVVFGGLCNVLPLTFPGTPVSQARRPPKACQGSSMCHGAQP
jgi:hypothetical protein